MKKFSALRPHEIILWGFLFGILGLLLGVFFVFSWLFWFLFLLGVVPIVFFARPFLYGIGVIVLFCGYAQWRGNLIDSRLIQTHQIVTSTLESPYRISGIVKSFPEQKNGWQKFYFKAESIPSLIRVEIPNGRFDYGDQLSFVCSQIKIPETNGFDYKGFLNRKNTYGICRSPQAIEVLSNNQGPVIWQKAYNYRERFKQRIQSNIPSPHNKIATGVLIGVKDAPPEILETQVRHAGLTHLLVVSGTNVAIVIIILSTILRGLGRRVVVIGLSIGIVFFVGVTGADVPVMRAAIMGFLAGCGRLWGRPVFWVNLILLATLIVGLIRPSDLLYDIGFQLSFVATVGILSQQKRILSWANKVPTQLRWLFEILAISWVAQIFVLPVLVWHFGYFSMGGFLANLLVEPIIPFLMLGSFFSGVFSGWGGAFLGFCTTIFIDYFFYIASVFSRFGVVML